MFDYNRYKTPYYLYDLSLLDQVLHEAKEQAEQHDVSVFFALKANYNSKVLAAIQRANFGVECVSGGEITLAVQSGFSTDKIGLAGAAKSDEELRQALNEGIGSLHVESLEELTVLAEMAEKEQKSIRVLVRLNPNVHAATHEKIRTGTQEDKFGVPEEDLPEVVRQLTQSKYLKFEGVHYHIGSQIQDMKTFALLVDRARQDLQWFQDHGMEVSVLNFGGGLGVDYSNAGVMPDFSSYFSTLQQARSFFDGEIRVELGRSLVAHCAELVTRVLFTKGGGVHPKVLVDAGMNDFARPALYGAYHPIRNVSAEREECVQNVFGPICESSDCFAKGIVFSKAQRGDLLSIAMVGAYGETMQSGYNLREKCAVFFKE